MFTDIIVPTLSQNVRKTEYRPSRTERCYGTVSRYQPWELIHLTSASSDTRPTRTPRWQHFEIVYSLSDITKMDIKKWLFRALNTTTMQRSML